jgi:hypothetical protein
MGEKLVNIKADTAREFLDEAHKAMKDRKKLGETTYKLEIGKVKLDPKTKTVASGSFTLTMDTTRVHWAGAKKTKPGKMNAEAITKIENLNEAHEKAHRDGYQEAFDKAKDELEKKMVGKTQKEQKDILEEMHDKLKDACLKLHKTGGMIDVSEGDDKITVSESAEGPSGCE